MIKLPFNRSGGPPAKTVGSGNEEGLSTFGGVFTPSILTILGVIMYLRFGWVVGNVGLLGTLLIVTMSTAITFLTALSIAAIATDQRVRVGGAYYMVSRSLGIEIGGAIGIPLFLAQALSVALYTVGFAESIVGVFPTLDLKLIGLITTLLVAVLALTSANVAIKAQYFIMAAIALSLISLILGKPVETPDVSFLGTTIDQPEPFWKVFAVFFPAVTGIMAGVNLSGDLRNPEKSIPSGTFAAVGTGYVIYMALPVVLALRVSAQTLVDDPLIMRQIAWWGDAILLGVWGATLSSAIGSMLGAPRVLQALALDGVLPRALRRLGRGVGVKNTPRAGTVVTLILALVAVWLGDLNLIAPVLSMFFLTTYAVLNIAAGIESFLDSPSFRPTFSVHWALSLLGAVGCVAVMLLINAAATAVAGLFVVGIFVWLQRRSLQTTWGDVREGIWMSITRAGLLRLTGTPDPKNWRPHLLVLSGAPTRRWYLIDLATSWTHNQALMTVATVATDPTIPPERLKGLEENISEYLAKQGVQALVRTVAANTAFEGARSLISSYGLGALVPNTLVLGDTLSPGHLKPYCDMIQHFHRQKRNVVIVKPNEEEQFGERKRIDVWWGGLKGNGGLMKILAYLLQTSVDWGDAEVRIKIVVPNEAAAEGVASNLTPLVDRLRTGATLDVILSKDRPFDEILRTSSADADIVFMGMADPAGVKDYSVYYEQLRSRTDGMPSAVFVLAAEDIGFEEVLA